ncbi:MAG: SurA N-terminal domain-containing protein [Proteobacteria bacterium]|nr:SurA N-terminal domain-containing protein [Pseudomonadota bacterium]
MLQELRKYTRSWVASLFMGALALSFGLWGINNYFQGRTDTSVAVVGGVEIPIPEYQRDFQNMLKQRPNPDGSPMTVDQARKLGLPAQSLEAMISRQALDNQVRKLGLITSDERIVEQMHAIPIFAGPQGTFDRQTMVSVLQRYGFTEQQFIENSRADVTRSQLLDATNNGFSFPYGYTRALYAYISELRAVEYIVMPASAAGAIATPDDATILAYMKAHADRFSTPEYRVLTYASIGPEDLLSRVQVTDQQLKQQYELDQAKYQVPETRDVQQLTFPDEASAKAASAKILSGKSFADVAKDEKKTDADIAPSTVVEADLGGERGKAAFALAEGGTSLPVKGTFGWVIFHIAKITQGVNKSFDSVKDDIRKEVGVQLAQSNISDMINAFQDAQAAGETIDEAGKKTGMHITHIAAVDRNGLGPDGQKANVPADPDFMKQVFTAEIGEDGNDFQTKDGHTYVIKVTGVTPPKLKPIATAKAEVIAAWQKEQARKQLDSKAKQLAAQATMQQSLASVAKMLAATPKILGPLNRASKDMPLTSQLVQKIFSAKPGTAVYDASADGNGIVIARVIGAIHPPNTGADPQVAAIGQQLGRLIADDFSRTLAKNARDLEGVTINQKNVDGVTGEGS